MHRAGSAQAGVYHQIKRMFGIYGAGVNALHRDAIGGLALDAQLAPGQWRSFLTPKKWQKLPDKRVGFFTAIFKKTSHFSGKIRGPRTTQKGIFGSKWTPER